MYGRSYSVAKAWNMPFAKKLKIFLRSVTLQPSFIQTTEVFPFLF